MENEEILDLPVNGRAGTMQSVDDASRTFEVLWTTGAQVRRYSWARDEEFDEEYEFDDEADFDEDYAGGYNGDYSDDYDEDSDFL